MPDNENPILKSNSTVSDLFGDSSLSSSKHQRTWRKRLVDIEQDDSLNFKSWDDLDLDGQGDRFESNHQAVINEEEEKINSNEIFDLIRSITDPEHPLTLEDLSVVSAEQISVTHPDDPEDSPHVMVRFTPTIPHCSMATLIGLTLRVRLLRSLPERFKVDIKIKEGTHQSENSVNKQLNDKERVAAALENSHLLGVVQQCLSTAHLRGSKQAAA